MSDNLSTESIRKDFGVKPSRSGGMGGQLLLLLLVAATAVLGYFSWQQQQAVTDMQASNQSLTGAAASIASLQQQQAQAIKNSDLLDQRLKALEQNLQQLQALQQQQGTSQQQTQMTLQQQLQMTLSTVNDQTSQLNMVQQELKSLRGKVADTGTGALRSQILAEALGMLRLAEQRLQVAQDLDTATTLVRNADALLAKLADTSVVAVRSQLAEDLVALQPAQQGDSHKVYQQLGEAITQLSLLSAVSKTATNDPTVKAPAERKSADSGWFSSAVDYLSQYFVISQRDAPVTPLLSPEQSWLIRRSIELQLQQARIAALNNDAALYKSSLMDAQAAITENLQGEGKDALLKKLALLQSASLRGGIHSLAASIAALQQLQASPGGKTGNAP